MADDDDIGTSRWFGASWGAPVCMPAAHVGTPVGDECYGCDRPIVDGEQGIGVPHFPNYPEATDWRYGWYHLDCWMRSIGAEITAEVLGDD